MNAKEEKEVSGIRKSLKLLIRRGRWEPEIKSKLKKKEQILPYRLKGRTLSSAVQEMGGGGERRAQRVSGGVSAGGSGPCKELILWIGYLLEGGWRSVGPSGKEEENISS